MIGFSIRILMRRLISRWKIRDLDEEAFQDASVLHICSGTMFHPTALKTTREAVRLAKKIGVPLSFDANIRPLRWESEETLS